MKVKFLLAAVVIISFVGISAFVNRHATPASTASINFIEQDWQKALTEAKSKNKLVFVDVYATWCGPCRMLKQKTFTNKKVADFFNANFVNVSVDAEKGVGVELSNKFGVSAYPTLLVTDASGKPLLYTVGYMEPGELLSFANAAIKKKGKS